MAASSLASASRVLAWAERSSCLSLGDAFSMEILMRFCTTLGARANPNLAEQMHT